MSATVLATQRWPERRRRAKELEERWPFAVEVLSFYGALLEVQQAAFELALEHLPERAEIPAFAARRAVPQVVEVSLTSGPLALQAAVLQLFDESSLERLVQ